MPPYLMRGGNRMGGRTWLTSPEPMVYPSWAAMAKELFWSYIGAGEVFLYATETLADGYPNRFMVLNPAFVQVDRVDGDLAYTVGGAEVDPADILHIKYASWPGDLRGHGPLETAGARLLTVTALTRYASNLAASGGLPPAILKYPRRASRAQLRQMQADWITARTSAMGLPAVLADGLELETVAPQLKDAALADLERFSEARIATLLSVPPMLVGLGTEGSSTYVNSTNVFDFHWRAGLRPKAEAVCGALSTWLLPRGWAVELDRDEYIKPGMFERAQSYAMLIGAQVLSPAEVRVMERYDTDPGDQDPGLSGADEDTAEAPQVEVPGSPGRPTQTNVNSAPQEATA
jgi:HK97 family phage portal protein